MGSNPIHLTKVMLNNNNKIAKKIVDKCCVNGVVNFRQLEAEIEKALGDKDREYLTKLASGKE